MQKHINQLTSALCMFWSGFFLNGEAYILSAVLAFYGILIWTIYNKDRDLPR